MREIKRGNFLSIGLSHEISWRGTPSVNDFKTTDRALRISLALQPDLAEALGHLADLRWRQGDVAGTARALNHTHVKVFVKLILGIIHLVFEKTSVRECITHVKDKLIGQTKLIQRVFVFDLIKFQTIENFFAVIDFVMSHDFVKLGGEPTSRKVDHALFKTTKVETIEKFLFQERLVKKVFVIKVIL